MKAHAHAPLASASSQSLPHPAHTYTNTDTHTHARTFASAMPFSATAAPLISSAGTAPINFASNTPRAGEDANAKVQRERGQGRGTMGNEAAKCNVSQLRQKKQQAK